MGGAFDFVGDIIDTGGDILGGVGDVIGDVAGGIGDLVGSLDLADAAKAFIMSGGNPYAAAIAATGVDESLGFNPGSFMSGDFSSFGGGDLGGIGGGGFDLSVPDFGGLGDLGNFDLSEVGSSFDLGNLGTSLGDIVDYGDYAQLGDAYNTATSVLDNIPISDYNPEIGTTFGDNFGSITDYYSDYNPEIGTTFGDNLGSFPQIDTSSGGGLFDTVKGGLDTAVEWYKKYGKPATSIAKLITSYQAGQLSKKQQEELNRLRQAQYDKYNEEKSAFTDLIASGNLPSLNITRGTTPTVKMAMGGITNLRPRTSMGIMGVNR